MDPIETPTQTLPRGHDLAQRLGGLITQVRDRRRASIEPRMLDNHAAWAAQRRRYFYNSPTFQYYIPVARRAIERAVNRATQMLFPSPDFFDVFPGDETDLQAGRSADAVRAYVQHLMDTKINMRRIVSQCIRSLYLYHRAIVKNSVTSLDQEVRYGAIQGRLSQVWPTTRVVDPFAFYVWPETVTELDDAVIVFEDVMLPYSEYESAAERGVCQAIKRDDLGAPEWPIHMTDRLSHLGLTAPGDVGQSQPAGTAKLSPSMFVALTEAWFRVKGQLTQAWLVWNVPESPRIVRFHDAQYPVPPYRQALARPMPGEQYTSGMMDDIETLQILFNDQINQGEEARSIAALPPILVQASLSGRTDSYVYGHRRKWFVDSPQSVMAMDIKDTSLASMRAAQMTLAQINSLGGSNPSTEGQPTRGLPRAGGAVQSLLALAMADIKDTAQIIEHDLLTPTLRDLHRLSVAFVPESQRLMIPGSADAGPRSLTKADLYGNWDLRWIGPQHDEELRQKAQVMMPLAAGLAKLEPQLQASGYRVRWELVAKRVWRRLVGEEGAESIIAPVEGQAQNPAALGSLLAQLGQAPPAPAAGPEPAA